MIYMEPMQLGWEPLVKSWMKKEVPENFTEDQKNMISVGKDKI